MQRTRSSNHSLAALMLGTMLLVACGGAASATSTSTASLNSRSVPIQSAAGSATVGTPSASYIGTASLVATLGMPPSPLHPAGTLTNADNGKTMHFQVGDTIDLALKAANGFQNWDVATPDITVLVPTVNPAAAAVRGATLRAFQAVGTGQTAITASSKPDCPAGQACSQLVQAFKVTVMVGG